MYSVSLPRGNHQGLKMMVLNLTLTAQLSIVYKTYINIQFL